VSGCWLLLWKGQAQISIKVKCPACGALAGVSGPGRYDCRKCKRTLVVDAGPAQSMSIPVSGVIPWGALSPEVKRVLHEGRERVAAGRGPGTALRGVTKRLGIKPCPRCFRWAAALNQLGWPVVIGFTVVVLAVGVGLSRWFFPF